VRHDDRDGIRPQQRIRKVERADLGGEAQLAWFQDDVPRRAMRVVIELSRIEAKRHHQPLFCPDPQVRFNPGLRIPPHLQQLRQFFREGLSQAQAQ